MPALFCPKLYKHILSMCSTFSMLPHSQEKNFLNKLCNLQTQLVFKPYFAAQLTTDLYSEPNIMSRPIFVDRPNQQTVTLT